MSSYYNTVKHLGFKDCLSRQDGRGRISNFSSISRQLSKAHDDGYHPRMSRQLATALKRFINTRPKHEKRTPEFVDQLRRKILCLHEYNMQVAKEKCKYPRSEQFDTVLMQYVELECGLLYDTRRAVDEEHENNVTQRVLRLLRIIFHDALHSNDDEVKTTKAAIQACDKDLLKFFVNVRADFISENKLVTNAVVKLLRNLNLLDDVNQLKGKHISFQEDTFLRDPRVHTIRQSLVTSGHKSDFDDDDDDLIFVFDDPKNQLPSKDLKDLPLQKEAPDPFFFNKQKSKENCSHVQNNEFDSSENDPLLEVCFPEIFQRPAPNHRHRDRVDDLSKSNDIGIDNTPFFKKSNILGSETNEAKTVSTTVLNENRRLRDKTLPATENVAVNISVQKMGFSKNSEIDEFWQEINSTPLINAKSHSLSSENIADCHIRKLIDGQNTKNSVEPMETTSAVSAQKDFEETLPPDEPDVIEILEDPPQPSTVATDTRKSVKSEIPKVATTANSTCNNRVARSANNFTIDLDSLPAKSQFNGAIITIDLLDDDDDVESSLNEVRGSSEVSNPVDLLESGEIKQEKNEGNRSPNFPVPRSDDDQNFLNSNKSSRNSGSSGVNGMEQNPSNDSAKETDASIVISDSEDELVDDVSGCNEVADSFENISQNDIHEVAEVVCEKESLSSVSREPEVGPRPLEAIGDDEEKQQEREEIEEQDQQEDLWESVDQGSEKNREVEEIPKVCEEREREAHNEAPNVIESSFHEQVVEKQNEIQEKEQLTPIEVTESNVVLKDNESTVFLADHQETFFLPTTEELGSEMTLETVEIEHPSDIAESYQEPDTNAVEDSTKLIDTSRSVNEGEKLDTHQQEASLPLLDDRLEMSGAEPTLDLPHFESRDEEPNETVNVIAEVIAETSTTSGETVESVTVIKDLVQIVAPESQTSIEGSYETTEYHGSEQIIADNSSVTLESETIHGWCSGLVSGYEPVNIETARELQTNTVIETSIVTETGNIGEISVGVYQSEKCSKSQRTDTTLTVNLHDTGTVLGQSIEGVVSEDDQLGQSSECQNKETEILNFQQVENADMVADSCLPERSIENQSEEIEADLISQEIEPVECFVESDPSEQIENQNKETVRDTMSQEVEMDVGKTVECIVESNSPEQSTEYPSEETAVLLSQETAPDVGKPEEYVADAFEQNIESQKEETVTNLISQETVPDVDKSVDCIVDPSEQKIESQGTEPLPNLHFQEIQPGVEECIVSENGLSEENNRPRDETTVTPILRETEPKVYEANNKTNCKNSSNENDFTVFSKNKERRDSPDETDLIVFPKNKEQRVEAIQRESPDVEISTSSVQVPDDVILEKGNFLETTVDTEPEVYEADSKETICKERSELINFSENKEQRIEPIQRESTDVDVTRPCNQVPKEVYFARGNLPETTVDTSVGLLIQQETQLYEENVALKHTIGDQQGISQTEDQNVVEEAACSSQPEVSPDQDSALVIEEQKMIASETLPEHLEYREEVTCEAIDYSITSQYVIPSAENSVTYLGAKENQFSSQDDIPCSLDKDHPPVLSPQVALPNSETEIVESIIPSHIPEVSEVGIISKSLSIYTLPSTVTENYDVFNAEKKVVDLHMLADIAAERETLAIKTDSKKEPVDTCVDADTLTSLSETPKRRKSKVRFNSKTKFSPRKPLPRTVKQNTKYEVRAEEAISKGVPRNMGIKAKPEIETLKKGQKQSRTTRSDDSKYKPHDFISIKNSLLPHRTNNVYAQKRLVEANTTSEDSNDSCESTLFIDLGESLKQIENIKSVYDEETICDSLEFVTTEYKDPERENFHILKEMESFISNNNHTTSNVIDVEEKDQLPTKSIQTKITSDQDASNAVANALFDSLRSKHKKAKLTKTINHSIEHILNKTVPSEEIQVIIPPLPDVEVQDTSQTPAVEALHVDAEKQNVTASDDQVIDGNHESVKSDKLTMIEFDSESKKTVESVVVALSIPEVPVAIQVDTSEQEQPQPTNLVIDESIVAIPKLDDNCEKAFKTKAAMKAYEDKLHPNPYVLLQHMNSASNTDVGIRTRLRSKSSEQMSQLVPSERVRSSSVDLNSITLSIDSSLHESTGSSGFDESREFIDGLSDKSQSHSSELDRSCDSHEIVEVNSKQDTIELHEGTDEKKTLLCHLKITNSHDAPSLIQTEEPSKELNQIEESVSLPTLTDPKEISGQITSEAAVQDSVAVLSVVQESVKDEVMLTTANVSVPEITVFSKPDAVEELTKEHLQMGELTKESLQKEEFSKESLRMEELTKEPLQNEELTEGSLQKDQLTEGSLQKEELTKESLQKDDNLISLQAKKRVNKTSVESHSKISKIPDQAKGRSLENTIKKMKEKIEEAKKDSASLQPAKNSEIKSDFSTEKKQHKKSKSEDAKQTNKEESKRTQSRSLSKAKSLDKKSEHGIDNEKSSSRSSDKRSKHRHSDNEGDRQRRSHSKSLDDKDKSKLHHSDNETDKSRQSQPKIKSDKQSQLKIKDDKDKNGVSPDGHRRRSSKSPSKSRNKQSSSERTSSRHKTSGSKERTSQQVVETVEHRPSKTRSQNHSKPVENNPEKIEIQNGKVEDKSEVKPTENQVDKSPSSVKINHIDKDKHRDTDKSKSRKRGESQSKSVHDVKSSDPHKKESRSRDKSRRSHSKEKTKLHDEKREKKEKHRDEKNEGLEKQQLEKSLKEKHENEKKNDRSENQEMEKKSIEKQKDEKKNECIESREFEKSPKEKNRDEKKNEDLDNQEAEKCSNETRQDEKKNDHLEIQELEKSAQEHKYKKKNESLQNQESEKNKKRDKDEKSSTGGGRKNNRSEEKTKLEKRENKIKQKDEKKNERQEFEKSPKEKDRDEKKNERLDNQGAEKCSKETRHDEKKVDHLENQELGKSSQEEHKHEKKNDGLEIQELEKITREEKDEKNSTGGSRKNSRLEEKTKPEKRENNMKQKNEKKNERLESQVFEKSPKEKDRDEKKNERLDDQEAEKCSKEKHQDEKKIDHLENQELEKSAQEEHKNDKKNESLENQEKNKRREKDEKSSTGGGRKNNRLEEKTKLEKRENKMKQKDEKKNERLESQVFEKSTKEKDRDEKKIERLDDQEAEICPKEKHQDEKKINPLENQELEKGAQEEHKNEKKNENPDSQEKSKKKEKDEKGSTGGSRKNSRLEEKTKLEKRENKIIDKKLPRDNKRKSHASEESKSRTEENGVSDEYMSKTKKNYIKSIVPASYKLRIPKKRKYNLQNDHSDCLDQNTADTDTPKAKIAKIDETPKEAVPVAIFTAKTYESTPATKDFFSASKEPTEFIVEKVPEVPIFTKQKITKADEPAVKVTDSACMEVTEESAATGSSQILTEKEAQEVPIDVPATTSKADQRVTPKSCRVEAVVEAAVSDVEISVEEKIPEVPAKPIVEELDQHISESAAQFTKEADFTTSVSTRTEDATVIENFVEAPKEPVPIVVSKIPTEEIPVIAKEIVQVAEDKSSSLTSTDLDGSSLDIAYKQFSSGMKIASVTDRCSTILASPEKNTIDPEPSASTTTDLGEISLNQPDLASPEKNPIYQEPSVSTTTDLREISLNQPEILTSTANYLAEMELKKKTCHAAPIKLLGSTELDRITATQPVFTVFSTSQNIDGDVLKTPIVSTVKLPGQDADLSLIPSMSTPVTLRTVSTDTVQQKSCLFAFNEDAEAAVNRENIGTSEIFHTPLDLDDMSPTKLRLASHQSLEFLTSSTSMAEISNSIGLVQTLRPSTINFDVSCSSEEPNKQNFESNFVTRVAEINFEEKESTADHTYTLGDPLVGGNREDKITLTSGLSLSSSPEDFQLNETHLDDISFNENTFIGENGGLEELELSLLPCKKEKPDFEIDDGIPKPEDIQNSIKHLNMLVDISQAGQQQTISVDNTLEHSNNTDFSVISDIDYAVSKILFLSDGEVKSQNNSYSSRTDIDNIMEPVVPPVEQRKQLEIPPATKDDCSSIPACSTSFKVPKVVVETIEQYPMTLADQMKEDYNSDTCKTTEPSKPNALKSSIKSSYKSRLLECLKKEPVKNENLKTTDEMENYTSRRYNRTPVLPPKNKNVAQQITKSPPEAKKSEILSFDTNSTKVTSEPGRIRVKTDLIQTIESAQLNHSLEYINEHDQNIASEVVLPYSKPSPGTKNDSQEKRGGVVAANASHKSPARDNKKIFPTNADKKRKMSSSDNERHDEKRARKSDDLVLDKNRNSSEKTKSPDTAPGNKKSKNVEMFFKVARESNVNNSKTNELFDKGDKKSKNDELCDKSARESTVNKSKTDELFDKLLREGNVNKVLAQSFKKDVGNATANANVNPRGHSTPMDPHKKDRHHVQQSTSPHVYDHSGRSASGFRKRPAHYASSNNVPTDRHAKLRHIAVPGANHSFKSPGKNFENFHKSKSEPSTTRDYRPRDRRMSTEQPRPPFRNSGTTEKEEDPQYSWLKKVEPVFADDNRLPDLFSSSGSTREDPSSRK